MKKKKKMNLPLYYETSSFDSERFLKVRIKVMHSGLNLNNSYFSSEVIAKAQPTLANVPILAFVKKEDGSSNEDFAGHEFEIKITEDDMKYVYLGRPIGLIPETNNYSIETDEDGIQFVVVDGYIWKQYANSALDIINRDKVKKVSMEIIVDEYDWEDNYIQILDYSYTGIAMLGEDVREAMIGAKAEIITYAQSTIADMMFELKEALKGGEEKMADVTENIIPEEELQFDEEQKPDAPIVESQPEPQPEPEVEPQPEPEVEPEVEEDLSLEEGFSAGEPTEELSVEDVFAAERTEFETRISQLEEENAQLKAFVAEVENAQKEEAIKALFAAFEDLQDDENAQALKAKAKKLNLQDVETQLFALRGKKVSVEVEKQPADWQKLIFQYSANSSPEEPEWANLVRNAKKE